MSALQKFFIIVFFSCFAQLPLLAAEAQPDNDAEQTDEAQQQEGNSVALEDPASGDTTEEAEEEESPSRFIPTEQISQDLGVSFPADI